MEPVDAHRTAIEPLLRRQIDHLEQSLGGGQGLLRRRRRLRELLERRQQAHHENHERDEGCAVHAAALQHRPGADPENEHGDRRADHFSERLGEEGHAGDANRPFRVAMTGIAKPLVLVGFAGEGLHQPNATHDFLQHTRDFAVIVAQPAMAAPAVSSGATTSEMSVSAGDILSSTATVAAICARF